MWDVGTKIYYIWRFLTLEVVDVLLFNLEFFVCLLQITQLKIDNNPFAKGFRDTGAGKREKK